tara:strand:+ start:725 stop:1186 length:462 start_codon:yes stop_codon:yes gene_type:complete
MEDLDFENVEVEFKINGKEVDCLKTVAMLNSSIEKEGQEAAESAREESQSAATEAAVPVDKVRQFEHLLERVSSLKDSLARAESELNEACSDAISAASSSYYCGDYASEAANEAGWEHHPGEECLGEQRVELTSIYDDFRALVLSLQPEEPVF